MGLLDPILSVFDPSRRTAWPFLLGALLIALIVLETRGRSRGSPLRFLFPRRIWLHASALLDYRLMFARAVVRWTLLAPLELSELALAVLVATWLSTHVAPASPRALGDAWVVMLFSVSVFVAEDFARYLVHLAAHRVPALWELHKVHHSAEVLTPFSVHRTHPLESLLMRSGATFATGLTIGLFAYLFPGRIEAWQIGGVYALNALWTTLGANLRHSHVWLSYGRVLEHVFISPAQHQLHHADRPELHHKNMGSALAIWDWAFGTLMLASRERPALTFGLPPALRNHRGTVLSVLVDPLRAAVAVCVPRRAAAARSDSDGRRDQ